MTPYFNNPKIQQYAEPFPAIPDGSGLPANPVKEGTKDSNIQTQEKELTGIESDFGPGGNYSENIVRNKHTVVGAAMNTAPQGYVIPKGKRITAAVGVSDQGTMMVDAGIPIVHEVDNWSRFPCGSYNVDAGNRFSVRAGGGGVHMVSAGGASLMSETITRIGATETLVTGDAVYVKGNKSISLEGELVNLKSDTQVVVDSTLGVVGNVVVQGGSFTEGEVFVNHITAPREIQQTLIGFTKEGAVATLTYGSWIAGAALIGGVAANKLGESVTSIELAKQKTEYAPTDYYSNVPSATQWPFFPDYAYDSFSGDRRYFALGPPEVAVPPAATTKVVPIKIFLGLQENNAVMLRAHGHEFPNLPLTLLEDNTGSVNNKLRKAALDAGVNKADVAIAATPIVDGPKYTKDGLIATLVTTGLNLVFNFPGMDKTYSKTGL